MDLKKLANLSKNSCWLFHQLSVTDVQDVIRVDRTQGFYILDPFQIMLNALFKEWQIFVWLAKKIVWG